MPGEVIGPGQQRVAAGASKRAFGQGTELAGLLAQRCDPAGIIATERHIPERVEKALACDHVRAGILRQRTERPIDETCEGDWMSDDTQSLGVVGAQARRKVAPRQVRQRCAKPVEAAVGGERIVDAG